MWWLVTAAYASASATLTWSGDTSRLFVNPPEGEVLSADGPARLTLRRGEVEVAWTGTGGTLGAGVDLGDVRGEQVAVLGTVTSCSHDTGVCRPWELSAAIAVPDRKKGSLEAELAAPERKETPFRADAERAATAAFADATASGRPVLLDFGAVWCPPCNLLAAQVLDADPRPPELERVVTATLDVDDPSSFGLKDRYEVGGYPTVVIARPDGTELSRMVGYPGKEEFLAWLTATAALQAPPPDPAERDPSAVEPAEAARIAWELVSKDRRDEAARWIARGDPESVELRLARFSLGGDSEDAAAKAEHAADAAWLAAHAPGHALDWAIGAPDADPAIQASARLAIDHDLREASGPEVADLLGLRAELVPAAEKPAWAAAALAALRTSLTGDPEQDRGYYTWLAELMSDAGDLDGAVAFLDAQTARWSDEPTFDLTAARLLNEAGRFADAKTRAARAMDRSWGDNHLRVTAQLCTALVGLGDPGAAAEAAKQALAAFPAPPDDQKVRTFRYRKALEKFLTP